MSQSSFDARRAYEAAVDNKESPEVLTKLWREFIEKLEREMAEKEERRAA
jgi:hypothetical protein